MKKTILTLALFAWCLIGFAQTTFNESTFESLNAQFRKEPVGWLQANSAENLTFIMDNGDVLNKKGVMSIYQLFDETDRKISDLKVYQNGQTGTAVGVMEHTLVMKGNKRVVSNKFRFSYTFQNQNSKWILVSGHHSSIVAPKFSENTLLEINANYIKNPVSFLQTEVAPNFLYTGTDGKPHNQQETIQIFNVLNDVSREYSDIKILQDGSNVVISAKMKHVVLQKQTNQQLIFNEIATLTAVYKKGKWLLQSLNHNNQ